MSDQQTPTPEPDPEINELLNSLDDEVEQPQHKPLPLAPPTLIPVNQMKAGSATKISNPQIIEEDIINDKSSRLDNILKKFETVSELILNNYKEDRNKIKEFVELYAQNIQSSDPKTSFVEGLTQLIGIQATATANSVKILDSLAKMTAASKNIQQDTMNLNGVSSIDSILGDFDENAA